MFFDILKFIIIIMYLFIFFEYISVRIKRRDLTHIFHFSPFGCIKTKKIAEIQSRGGKSFKDLPYPTRE